MSFLELLLSSLLALFAALTVIAALLARRYYGRWQTRQSKAFEMGVMQVRGDTHQLLGEFAVLGDYEQIITLSTTSKQASLDLIGVRTDSIDFIEFKKKGAIIQGPERKIQRLIREKKVNYVVKDVSLPEGTTVTDRES